MFVGGTREQLLDAVTTGTCKKTCLLLLNIAARPLLTLESHPGKGSLKECIRPRRRELGAFPRSS